MSETEVLHVIVAREKVGPKQAATSELARAVEAAMGEEPTALGALTTVCSQLGDNHNTFLREFGFSDNIANQLIPACNQEDS